MLTTRARGINSDRHPLFARSYCKEDIPYVWEELREHLQRCVEVSNGMLGLATTEKWLLSGDAKAFATIRGDVMESVVVTTFVEYPYYRSLHILALAGIRLKDMVQHFDLLQSWALLNECREIEGWVNPVMARAARKYGFRFKKTLISYNLRTQLQ